MNFYLLFTVVLYVGGCNARVVPLNFKLDKSKHVDSSITENELIDESPMDEVDILGHNLPDIGQSKDLKLLNSEEDKTVPDISNRNASNLSADLTPKEKAKDEESNLESAASSAISNLLEEKLDSTSEFISQNNSDSRDSFETIQVNGTLNDKTEDLTFKNETSITNNSSSLNLEQRNNLDFVKIKKVLNDTIDQSETFEAVNSDQNKTFTSFEAVNSDQNKTFTSFEAVNSDQNKTFTSEAVNSDQNETFTSFEVVNSDQNETSAIFEVVNGTNSTNDFFELQPLSNDTKVEVFLSNAENITKKFKSDNFTSENFERTNDSVKTDGGIFSGFEFLINSEVARNAAKAMEVFNFSDPLTDHIMEENEFHSFLPAFNAEQDLYSPNQTDLKTTITNSSGESNEIRADFNASLQSGDETSIVLNQAEPEETKTDSSMPFNPGEPLEEGNKTELFDLEGNVTSEVSSPLENSEMIQLASEATISKENIKDSVSNSSAVGVPECPPPGWCIFWFLSQDACAVNEHCLGSRICCKIGCSKTCIKVDS